MSVRWQRLFRALCLPFTVHRRYNFKTIFTFRLIYCIFDFFLKAFVDKFSEDLSTEYISQGIIVQSVLPGFVATNMTKLKRTNLFKPTAETFVQAAILTIGYSSHTTGYLPHAIMQLFINTVHAIIPETSNRLILKEMEGIRKKVLKRTKST